MQITTDRQEASTASTANGPFSMDNITIETVVAGVVNPYETADATAQAANVNANVVSFSFGSSICNDDIFVSVHKCILLIILGGHFRSTS